MFDIITIGSATRDVFIRSHEFQVLKTSKFKTGQAGCFSLGSKVKVDDIHFTCGGGAVNTAVTLASQGLKTASLFRVSEDVGAEEIFKKLEGLGVNASLVQRDKKYATAYSLILAVPGGERTILVYRGATENLTLSDIDWDKFKRTKWIYITHLGGESAKIFKPLVDFAVKNKIKIAFNPGRTQLKLGKRLVPYLDKIDVLILNREEASYLTSVPYKKENELFAKLDRWVKGIVVMTEGPNGLWVSDGSFRWHAGILKEKRLIDRTGAGDAFGSAFVSAVINGKPIDYAIQVGSANATGVLEDWGANEGLLKKGESIYKWGKIKIEKNVCVECR